MRVLFIVVTPELLLVGHIKRFAFPVAGHQRNANRHDLFNCYLTMVHLNLPSLFSAVVANVKASLNCRIVSIHMRRKTYFHSSSILRYSRIDAYNEWLSKFVRGGVSEPRESIETILSHVLTKVTY